MCMREVRTAQELTTDENKLTDRGRQLKKLINKKSYQDINASIGICLYM